MAIDLHIYYLPFYFQAAKGTSAQGSGVRILPYLITVFLTAIVAGTFMTFSRLYYPIMWFGAAVLTSGCTLIQTLRVTSGAGQWIGYQILCGIGFGMAFQVPYTIVQVVLEPNDVPTGNALVVFFQALGGALAVSIAQNIFGNELDRQLVKLSPEQVPNIIAAGATSISTKVPVELQGSVREAYSFALSRAFILPVVAAGAALLSGLGIERRIIETTNKKQL
ncbi:MAG: hypothetical protein M1822_009774 [Bathelium mastoideum]|nr:MAG: hypothetical protein M1822_009774 [Bathelium mastoideum]